MFGGWSGCEPSNPVPRGLTSKAGACEAKEEFGREFKGKMSSVVRRDELPELGL